MDNVQHPRNPNRATGDASGTETGRSPFLCRAWARDGAASALVAGSSHPSLEASIRRLSPEPRDRNDGGPLRVMSAEQQKWRDPMWLKTSLAALGMVGALAAASPTPAVAQGVSEAPIS